MKCASGTDPSALRCVMSDGSSLWVKCPGWLRPMEIKAIAFGTENHTVLCSSLARGAPETIGEYVEDWGWWLVHPLNAATAGVWGGIFIGIFATLAVKRLLQYWRKSQK